MDHRFFPIRGLKFSFVLKKGEALVDRNPSRLLLVEDEKNVGSTLLERLKSEGFDVVWVLTAAEALFQIGHHTFDLVLLDVGLPDGSGFDVGRFLRTQQPGAALMFLTAVGTPEDRIRGLELGAEDYIVKPFNLKELILRIRNGLKRARYITGNSHGDGASAIVGKATINFLRFEALEEGQSTPTPLTHKETALLKLMVEHRGSVVSRDEMLNHAWSEDEFPTPRTVDNFILRLRRLVEKNPEEPEVIKSVRGVGYQLL
jgi:two-component system alkaline phosphatase synthesis response regulator PhoP